MINNEDIKELTHLFKAAPAADDAINMNGGPYSPEHYAQTCRNALWNWGLRHMHGKPFPAGTRDWKSNEDALQAWNKALKYWESKVEKTE